MTQAVDVFTPNSFPTFTYVERRRESLEGVLTNALKVKNALISLSGPSKSGKTVLINKIIPRDNLIYIAGASIKAPGDLWRVILSWAGGPVEVVNTKNGTIGGSAGASAELKVGIPLVAKGGGAVEVGVEGSWSAGSSRQIAFDGLSSVAKEIAGTDFIVFIDDFHYINREVQAEVAKEVKAGAESGIRFCIASVPHRADDVVRGNGELRGRLHAVDTDYWDVEELSQIARQGFRELKAILDESIIARLAKEAFGSPQLMQAMCLNLAVAKGLSQSLPEPSDVDVSEVDLRQTFELTSAGANYQSLLESLHSGPRQRGTERKEFDLIDDSKGDVYRATLLAIRTDPGQLSFTYDEMQRRVRSVCKSEVPAGGSITRSLEQMDEIADMHQPKAIEWLDDVLDVVDPYFLFYLRASRKFEKLGG
jgi:hypothetical protein